jgi:hypothetical protein
MSDYHIQTQDDEKKSASVVFHIPIPASGTNEANLSWRDAIVREQGGSANITSVLPNIEATEDTKLKAGELLEVSRAVNFSSKNLTPAERNAEIVTFFNNLVSEIVAEKQITLEWIGYAADVV